MPHPTESRVFKAGWRCFCPICRTAIERGSNCKVVYINRQCKLCVHEKCPDTTIKEG